MTREFLDIIAYKADAVSIVECGRGAWQAAALEDAKEMAITFANGVG